jgi:PAS domain S-box-containing protein
MVGLGPRRTGRLWRWAGWLTTCHLALALLCPLWASSAQDQPERPLVAVIPADFPPIYFRDGKTGQPAGLAVEVMDALASRAGLKVAYRFAKPWEEIESLLLSGEADLIPFRVINRKTSARFIFTRKLDVSEISYIVKSGGAGGEYLHAGGRIGVIKGGTGPELVPRDRGLVVVPHESMQQLCLALLAGQVDAALTVNENFMYLAKEAGLDDRFQVIQPPLEAASRAIALRQGAEGLRDRLDQAMEGLTSSPDFQLIYGRWHGSPPRFWTPERLGWAVAGLLGAAFLAMALWRYLVLLRFNRQLTTEMTERRRAEAKAAELANIVASSVESIIGMDLQGFITSWNQAAENLYGYSAGEALGRHISLLIPEGHADRHSEIWGAVLTGGTVKQYETVRLTKDGRLVEVSLTISPLVDDSGDLVGMSGISRDIGERKRAEADLRESEEKYRQLVRLAPSGIYEIDLTNLKILSVNDVMCRYTGYSREELLALDPMEMLSEQSAQLFQERGMMRASGRQVPETVEFQIKKKDGGFIWALLNIKYQRLESGAVLASVVANDITERKQAERERAAQEEKFRALFNSMTELTVMHELVCDQTGQPIDYRIIDCNPAFTHITGISRQAAVGQLASKVYGMSTPPYLDIYACTALTGAPAHFDSYFKPLDKNFTISAFATGQGRFATIATDVTQARKAEDERIRVEAQLRQAQKMEAIGTLAGGIAHDFNNILAAVLGFAEIAHEDAISGSGRAKPADLAQIIASAQRARELVQQILTFSRKKEPDLKPVDLNQIIQRVQGILERTLPKMIGIQSSLAPGLPCIQGDPTQIEQVLLNLASNAQDAMPEGGGLAIETRLVELDQEYCQRHLEIRPGPYLLLTVGDTGVGMDDQTREHIFEPFYTTKAIGKGTGLGLSSAYGIVKNHGGHIHCLSKPGQGTTFNIYLPALREALAQPASESPGPGQEGVKGTETILLVDDDAALRQLGERVLRRMGYQVVTAASGEEALEIHGLRGDQLDLVIMDLGMPGMGGHRAIGELLARHPTVKVIVASGYAAHDQVRASLEAGAVGYVAKPFKRSELLATIRGVLDGK